MKLTKEQFIEKTLKMAENTGIQLNEKQLEKLYLYKEMLLEWNEKINLTAITDDEEIISKHIVDSLQITKYIDKKKKVIDVGTGAGLPGIIIAIYFEGSVNVTLFDALNKRIIFLKEVIDKLGLKNVEAIHGRAEETSREKIFRETYDIVVSRAVARLNILLELTVPFVKLNGLCLYMKADKTSEELKECNKAIKELGIQQINIDKYNIEMGEDIITHTIIRFKKQETTKCKYPRQFSKIKKSPL